LIDIPESRGNQAHRFVSILTHYEISQIWYMRSFINCPITYDKKRLQLFIDHTRDNWPTSPQVLSMIQIGLIAPQVFCHAYQSLNSMAIERKLGNFDSQSLDDFQADELL
jgi:hypothetical protein